MSNIVMPSVSVDASCRGNPGPMEYKGVHTESGATIFHKRFEEGTNNIGEFLAIVHAAALLKQNSMSMPIYSDSEIAILWVKRKRCNTNLIKNDRNEEVFAMTKRAVKWLRNNWIENNILKWNTRKHGEIPADFGRKHNFTGKGKYDLCTEAAKT